ncbi:DNA-binding protein [Nocardiopsis sp. N85]|uniref:DNA-binding protein n=1 Tax=Nocardiopsis sp. N85 TaxID=3029400 RepID=UPI00237F16BD|nr:DNA-binding protein [Nocardiopsis sp. N85]MDE3721229.1 DNA-binding protein [Nocardiopsis sp. N85]
MAPSPTPPRDRIPCCDRAPCLDHRGEGGGDPVATVRATTGRLIALDTRIGARDLVASAASAATAAHHLARRSHAGDRELLSAAAEAHQVAGWIAYDAEHQRLSRRMSLEALRLANAAGDRSMEHFALTQIAMQDVHLHRPAEASHLCDTALTETRGSVRTLFTLRAARATAQRGERARALGLIHLTYSRHREGPRDDDPPWAWWLNEAEIAWHHAMIHVDTGDRAGAVERFIASTHRPGYVRAVFVAHAALLWALARAHAWDEAETVLLRDVLPRLGEVSSVRVERMLVEAARLLDTAGRRPSLRDAAHGLIVALGALRSSCHAAVPGTSSTVDVLTGAG